MKRSGTTPYRGSRPIRVALGGRGYPLRIGTGTMASAGEEIARRTGARRVVVVTVPPVGRRYGSALERSIRGAGLEVRRLEVPDGDRSKNLRQVARLYDAMLAFRADRNTAVVALGGGVVGDLAGFLAATFLRGLPFVQVPTTLLAMADASIGGKVGVNLPQGKNLVGAFHQPRLVWIDLATLRSLPRRQRAAGLAEVIKAGAIRDAKLFARLERDVERILELDPKPLQAVVARACAIKAQIVSRDEREAGLRMLLNFGHTLGHAVETLKGYRGLLHGEAVAMGMAFAAGRSEALGIAPRGTTERVEALLSRAELPTRLPNFPLKAYLSALSVDKKRRGVRIRFVVLRRLGWAETIPLTAREIFPQGRVPNRAGASRSATVGRPSRKRG